MTAVLTDSALPSPGGELTHQGLFYAGGEEFLAATVPFCREGLARDDAILAVTTPANIDLLRRALGKASKRIEFADAADWYRTPGSTLGAYHRWVDRRTAGAPDRHVRLIGEPVWHGKDVLETAEWTRYESAVNIAFAGCAASIICPYDTRTLPDGVLADARRTHPEVAVDGAGRPSERYAEPTAGDTWRRPLAPLVAEGEEAVMCFGADLSPVRTAVAEAATALGLSGERAQRLVFAVNEVATNAVQHGSGDGRVIVRRAGGRVVCDVTSTGRNEADWYLGYLPPDPHQRSGHGMWVVRQLCDLLEVHTDHDSTTVRLHISLT
ncbi:anti-sigma factor RsbA family regulatory protein [Streptomyces sp. NPDC102395]|uniref:anti-sigma factor RsbA family regulatory protein n=1 Tax=Streptomyces sp. NPDC102395 TaxID=3366168 RepID=UPI0038233ABF